MNFLNQLWELITRIWPFRPVEPWERGFYTVLNRPRCAVGPGIWPVFPYFTDVLAVSVAEARAKTPLFSVPLDDGRQLECSISARVRVFDPKAAIVNVQEYQETTGEELEATFAEAFMEAKGERFETVQKRRNFVAGVVRDLNAKLAKDGVEVLEVEFTNWIVNGRRYRVVQDSALIPPSLTW